MVEMNIGWFLRSKMNDFVVELYRNSYYQYTDYKYAFVLYDMMRNDAIKFIAVALQDEIRTNINVHPLDDRSDEHVTLIKQTVNTLERFHEGDITDIVNKNFKQYEQQSRIRDMVDARTKRIVQYYFKNGATHSDWKLYNMYNVECGTCDVEKPLRYIFSNNNNLNYFIPYNSQLIFGFMKTNKFKQYCEMRLGPVLGLANEIDSIHERLAEKMGLDVETVRTNYSKFEMYLNKLNDDSATVESENAERNEWLKI